MPETTRHDVVLDFDAVLAVLGSALESLAYLIKEVGKTGVELDLGSQVPQHLVVETFKPACFDIGEYVVQIERVRPDEVGAL